MSEVARTMIAAEQAMLDGDWDKAQELYREALARDANNSRADKGLRDALRAVEKEADIESQIGEADKLFDAGDYKGAARAYVGITDYAVLDPKVLRFHPYLEQRRNQAKDLDVWQERASKVHQEIRQLNDQGNWAAAGERAEEFLHQLPQDPAYQRLRKALEAARSQALQQGDHQSLLDKAEALLRSGEFESGIEILEMIPPSSPCYDKANRWLGAARQRLAAQNRDLAPIEATIDKGEWTDALAQLNELQRQYGDRGRWKSLYLRAAKAYGKDELEAGRSYNADRQFSAARRHFQDAQKVFDGILGIYSSHSEIKSLRDECVDLVAIVANEEQAQKSWEQGNRDVAIQALTEAKRRLERAHTEGRDYTTVGSLVNAMYSSIQAEIEDIRAETRRLIEAEGLLEANRFESARQLFRQLLDARLPEHLARAQEGLHYVENKIQQFQTLMAQGNALGDPITASAKYQEAHNLWPDGPGVTAALETSLTRACEIALDAGRTTEAVGYGQRALELNPDNRAAHLCVDKAGIKPKIEEILQRVNGEWHALQLRDAIAASSLDPLLRELEGALREVEPWPDLRGKLEGLHHGIHAQRGLWQQYDQAYVRARSRRDAGDWPAALAALDDAIAVLGDAVPSGVRAQRDAWRDTVQLLERAQEQVSGILEQAYAAYAAVPGEQDLSGIQDGLDAVLKQLSPAHKLLESVVEQMAQVEGELPADLDNLQHRVTDLQRRAEVAADAAGTFSSSEGLLKIQEAIARVGSDDTLAAVRDSLEEKARERIALIKQQAQTDIAAGDLVAALEKLSQVRQLDPNDQETTQLYVEMQQRRKLQEKLRQVQQEAAGQLSSNSPVDAMRTLRRGLDTFMEPDVPLSAQAREILNALMKLSDSNDGMALDDPENWLHAQELLAALGNLRSENWVAALAIQIVDRWLKLARDNAQRGVVASAAQLGNLLQSYRSAAAYLKAHPTEAFAVQQLSDKQESLINKQNDSATKRLHRAQDALDAGDFSVALHNLRDIEQDFYLPIDSEFPGLLDGYPEVQDVRDEVANLIVVAQKLQSIYEKARPQLETAREAYRDNDWDTAEAALKDMPVNLGEIPELATQVETLRKQIATGRVNATRERLGGVLGKIEIGRQGATMEVLDDYIHELMELVNPDAPDALNIQVLDVEYRNRHAQLLGELRDQRESLKAGKIWEEELDKLEAQEKYVDALDALDKALAVTHQAEKRVAFERRRREIEAKANAQMECQSLLDRGHDLFVKGKYVEARQQFIKAQRMNADVDQMLVAARAGVLLLGARRLWEDDDGENALLDLDELDRVAEGNSDAEQIRDEARRLRRMIEKHLAGQREERRLLADIRMKMDDGDLDAAQKQLQELADLPGADALREQIRKRKDSQVLLEQARLAYDAGRYREALQHATTILEELVPHYPVALTLKGQIESAMEADQAIIEVEMLAKQHRFEEARAKLTELAQKNTDPEKLRQTTQLVEDLEREQYAKTVTPIRGLYEDGRYAEAWNRCKQAIGRTTVPDLKHELENLHGQIVNKWVEKQVLDTRRQLEKPLPGQQLSELEARLEPFAKLEPQPESHWLRQIEELLLDIRTRRLRSRIDEAQERYAAWKAEGMRGLPEAAQNIARKVQTEAGALGANVDFNILFDAEGLLESMEQDIQQRDAAVEEAQRAAIEAQRRKERDELVKTALDMRNQLEDPDYIAEESPGRPVLERVLDLVQQVFRIEGYGRDTEAQELKTWVDEALTAFDRTRAALDSAVKTVHSVVQGNRFREAEYELGRAGTVSPLLDKEYRQWQKVLKTLRRAENERENETWSAALQGYRQAIAIDPGIESLLEKDMERCYEQLYGHISQEVTQALEQNPPAVALARRTLEQAEREGWVVSTFKNDYERLYNWLASQDFVAQAAELLQVEGGDLDAAHTALRNARQQLPRGQSDDIIRQWADLAGALEAWADFQERPALLDRAQDACGALRPPVSELPRVKRLQQQLAEAVAKRDEANKHRLELQSDLSGVQRRVNAALMRQPRDFDGAVSELESARRDLWDWPEFERLCHDIQAQLKTLMQGHIKALEYAQAIEHGELLKRVPLLDAATRDWAIGLPEERRQELDARLHQAEAAVQGFDEHKAEVALRDAERIAAPRGDVRATKLRERLDTLSKLLGDTRAALGEVKRFTGHKAWDEAVTKLLAVRKDAAQYMPVVKAVQELQDALKAQAASDLAAGNFSAGLGLCDLALRLEPREDIRQLQQQTRDAQEAALGDVRRQIRDGLAIWQLEPLSRLFQRGLVIAPQDPELLELKARFDALEQQLPELCAAMEQGWMELEKRDYPAAKAAFESALSLVPQLSESQIWLDYTRALREATRMVEGESKNFASGADRLQDAIDLVRVMDGQSLPDLFRGIPYLREKRRHAVYNAWRLRQSARKIALWYKQSDVETLKGTLEAEERGYELFEMADREQQEFSRLHNIPLSPPDSFPVECLPDEVLDEALPDYDTVMDEVESPSGSRPDSYVPAAVPVRDDRDVRPVDDALEPEQRRGGVQGFFGKFFNSRNHMGDDTDWQEDISGDTPLKSSVDDVEKTPVLRTGPATPKPATRASFNRPEPVEPVSSGLDEGLKDVSAEQSTVPGTASVPPAASPAASTSNRPKRYSPGTPAPVPAPASTTSPSNEPESEAPQEDTGEDSLFLGGGWTGGYWEKDDNYDDDEA